MSDVYLTLADGFEKLAAGYRALAGQGAGAQPKEGVPAAAPVKESKNIDIEVVRAVLAEKSRDGQGILMKYDADRLRQLK